MNIYKKSLLILLILMGACTVKKTNHTFIKNVDPFIGTGAHGHTYPGATTPFGMLQVSPDNGISKWDWCSGYHYTDSITVGFSHLHLSGTGIGDLADIRLMPTIQKIDLTKKINTRNDVPYRSKYTHKKESATPGLYEVFLEAPRVKARLTSSPFVALHEYTFEKNASPSVVLDLGFTFNWDETLKSSITHEDDYTISGYRYSKGWAKNQKVFFVVEFSESIKKSNFVLDGVVSTAKTIQGKDAKAQFFFEQSSKLIYAKVALSSVDIAGAKANLQSHRYGFDFEKTLAKTQNTWEKALSKIDITTPDKNLKKIFYTALYHAQLAPVRFNDINDKVRLQNDSIVSAPFTMYSTLSLWDTFRAAHPLFTLVAPERVGDMVKTMLVYYNQHKRLPVWTLYGNETNTMTGYHSIPVIAEAIKKGLGDFNHEIAYEAMKKTMMQDDRGLSHYKKYGYIPYEKIDESVTITLEYAYNDWCVAQVAKTLGKKKDYDFFIKRSTSYRHLFDAETGFMRGKSTDGKSWHLPFDPKHSQHRIDTDYTEGNAWQHSWFVLHDPQYFINMHGGTQNFTKRLETLFTESSEITGEHVSADISGLIGQYAHGNEPSHHIAYLFNFAGQPWRTQYWVNQILKTQYDTTPEGLSGNEDCGQMSAWYVFSSLGLYPYNPASGVYQLTSPLFERSVFNLQGE